MCFFLEYFIRLTEITLCCFIIFLPFADEAGWSEEARLFVHNITFGRILQAQVVSYTETGMPLVNLFTSINSQVIAYFYINYIFIVLSRVFIFVKSLDTPVMDFVAVAKRLLQL